MIIEHEYMARFVAIHNGMPTLTSGRASNHPFRRLVTQPSCLDNASGQCRHVHNITFIDQAVRNPGIPIVERIFFSLGIYRTGVRRPRLAETQPLGDTGSGGKNGLKAAGIRQNFSPWSVTVRMSQLS